MARPCPSSSLGLGLGLGLLLLLLLVMVETAQASFPWPGTKAAKEQSQEDTAAAHHAAFKSITEMKLPKGVCLRTVRAGAYSTHAYPANAPIEDRHVLVDEQEGAKGGVDGLEGVEEMDTGGPRMLHAAVFDGHGTLLLLRRCICGWVRHGSR